ncbi:MULTISPECIES: hypothetical protein [Pantoea]|uniref:hypothetical protein n=1 Tax=Pantoea TaxID=53335 RepID=UPI000DA670DA|nr:MULTISPECIES: hypothetical protein [Pantoea]MDF7786067.1 hypothetical protein [Pantoea stewartii]PZD63550.1 hypothetical protein ARC272_11785 [Pantoea ananatis]
MISKKEKIAILQILAIKEGLTDSEYVKVLAEVERISASNIFQANKVDLIISKSKRDVGETIKNAESVMSKLKRNDPEKFNILNELKLNIRSGIILKNFNDVKDFLARIDQASLISTNKQSTVNNIIVYLSKKNPNDIREIIKSKIKPPSTNDDRGFNELANYIISPKK